MILPDITLHPARTVPQIDKGSLTHPTFAHDPPSDRNGPALHLVKLFHNLVRIGSARIGRDLERVFPLFLQGGELVPANLQNLRALLLFFLRGQLDRRIVLVLTHNMTHP